MFRLAPKDKPQSAEVPPGPPPQEASPEEMQEAPPEMMGQEESMSDPSMMMGEEQGETSPGSVDPSIVVYMSPEYGPFKCSNCVHFLQPNACHIVAGEINPEGICHVFTPAGQGEEQPPMGQEAPPEAAAPPEPPTEQPPQEGEGY